MLHGGGMASGQIQFVQGSVWFLKMVAFVFWWICNVKSALEWKSTTAFRAADVPQPPCVP